MGRRSKQTFLQRRHPDGQQAHEKILNITKYQRNANQNHNEVSPHTDQNGYHSKSLQVINANEGVEKREPLYTIGGNVNWFSHYGKQYGVSLKKLKVELPYDPRISLLGMYPERTTTVSKRYMHSNVHSSTIYNSQDMETAQVPINR